MFEICDGCGHSMSMHIGVTDMGGGHSEPLGCMHNMDGDTLCACLNYDKDGEDE